MNAIRNWKIRIDDSFCEYEFHLCGGEEYSIYDLIQIILVHARMNEVSKSLVTSHVADIPIRDDYMNWNRQELIDEIKRLVEDNQLQARRVDDAHERAVTFENKNRNLHKVINKQQVKIKRQAEQITTLSHLYTSGKRSKSHKKLREKYRLLKASFNEWKAME